MHAIGHDISIIKNVNAIHKINIVSFPLFTVSKKYAELSQKHL